jgi:hypothetical protein
MKKLLRELISDDNSINEQAFVGVVSFFAMVFVLTVPNLKELLGFD